MNGNSAFDNYACTSSTWYIAAADHWAGAVMTNKSSQFLNCGMTLKACKQNSNPSFTFHIWELCLFLDFKTVLTLGTFPDRYFDRIFPTPSYISITRGSKSTLAPPKLSRSVWTVSISVRFSLILSAMMSARVRLGPSDLCWDLAVECDKNSPLDF